MAPKSNAFMVYVNQFKYHQENKNLSMRNLMNKLTPMWMELSDEEKQKYKDLANEQNLNVNHSSPKHVFTEIVNMHKDTSDYYKMQNYVVNLFKSIADKNDLLDTNFILLHINSHSHDSEKYYFPAEIAALEFNLRNGINRTYHQLVGISNIYPRGYAGGMKEYADKFHQILCWTDHYDDYDKILLDFIRFIKNGNEDDEDICKNLPYIYTIETEVGSNMMKTKDSLEKLYRKVYLKDDAPTESNKNFDRVFNIGSLEQLFHEILVKMEVNKMALYSNKLNDILESDMYGHGLGCTYHEIRDIAFKCSKARILQWVSNICKFIHNYGDLEIIPGKHMTIQLLNGSKLIIENNNLPLSRSDLKYDYYVGVDIDYSETKPNVKPQDLLSDYKDQIEDNE